MPDNILRQLQLTQLEILRQIDYFCRNNHLRYSLYSGTQLGAVRHKGFIPWDDDLDICMPREDYDRFIRLWNDNGPKGFILQNKDTSPAFSQSFTKIRKNHTCFLQSIGDEGAYHHGIFVDVFPVDRMPNGWFLRKLFFVRGMLYQLYTREFIPPKESAFLRFGCTVCLWVIRGKSRTALRKRLERKLTKYNDNPELQMVMIETMDSLQFPYPCGLFDNLCELDFEGERFLSFTEWNEALKIQYGDYMQLPPEGERVWRHHPIILDFEHNYEELQNT